MPRTHPLGNFEVLGFRRHGFEAVRTPEPGVLRLHGRQPGLQLTAIPGPTPVAGLPFSEGYESGTRGNWQTNVGMLFTQADEYEGAWSSYITAVNGVGSDKYLEYNFGDHPSIAGTPVGERDIWLKFSHKWGSNWSDGSYTGLQKLMLLNLHNPASGQRRYQLTFNMWTPDDGYFCEFLRISEAGVFSGSATPNVSLGLARQLGVWVEFVFRVRMNSPGSSNGVLQIWTKGENDSLYTQRVERNDINYRDNTTFSPNRLIQSNYQPETVLSGTRYWDSWLLTEEPIPISSTPAQGDDFPEHSTGYVSLIPGTGGYGMNTPAGAGRNAGATVIFVNSLNAGNSGTAIDASLSAALAWGVPAYRGTYEYAQRHADSPKQIVFLTSGMATIQASLPMQTGTPPRPGFVSIYGQTAPAPGFFLRGCNVVLNGASDVAVWHLRSLMGDDSTGNAAGNRDCLSSGYGGGTTSRVVLINCEFQWSVDELCDFYRTHTEVSFLNCAFIEPLHDSTINHPEDPVDEDHGFGPQIGGDGASQPAAITTFRCLWAHTTDRNPLTNATTFTHANNLHYNHGRPGGGSGYGVRVFSSGDPIAANFLCNGFIRGPENNASMVAINVGGSLPPGSSAYAFGNAQFGWTAPANQNAFVTNAPAGYMQGTLRTSAIPGTWGGLNGVLQWANNPLAPTTVEWSDYVSLMERTVGAQPRHRRPAYSRLRTVFQQIKARLAGDVSTTGQFVDTVAQAGGWPSIPQVVINPLNPGAHWHAPIPTGPDVFTPFTSGAFSNGRSRIGYTRLEAWAFEQHLYVMRLDQIAPSVPADVVADAVSQTGIRLTWTASTDQGTSGLGGYRVYRSTTLNGTYAQVGADIPAGTQIYNDNTLSAGVTRFYRVLAFDEAGNVSATSSTVSATTHIDSGTGQFTPTHYVSASATGSGNGTQGNPFTLQQALAQAQPGWRVQLGPGIYTGNNTNTAFGACFQIAAQGTQANPIIFFAQNYAALNATGRTEFRNNAPSQGNGCPVIAASTGHHWYGIYINEDTARTHADTGPVVCSGRFNRFSYFRVSRGSTPWPANLSDNNHAAFRFEGAPSGPFGCQQNLVSDCWIENYSGAGASGSEQGVQTFSPTVGPNTTLATGLLTVEHCYFDNVQFAVTLKGAGSSRPSMGGFIIRRNLIRPSNVMNGGANFTGGVCVMDTSNELGRNQIYQNVQVGGGMFTLNYRQAGWPIRDVDVVNNTSVDMAVNNERGGMLGDWYSGDEGSGWRCYNNIKTGPANFTRFRYDGDAAMQARSHNISFGGSIWGYVNTRGTGTQSLAQWVANTVFDDNSSEANPLLVSSSWNNADLGKLQAGSPARNFGVDFLNLRGQGTSAPINAGAFITSDMSDVIGIRPLG